MKPLLHLSTYNDLAAIKGGFYKGSYSKGDFSLSNASLLESKTENSPKKILKQLNTLKSIKISTARADVSKADDPLNSSRTHISIMPLKTEEFRASPVRKDDYGGTLPKRKRIVTLLPSKVEKISSARVPHLGEYLKFLNLSPREEIDSFRSKMSPKKVLQISDEFQSFRNPTSTRSLYSHQNAQTAPDEYYPTEKLEKLASKLKSQPKVPLLDLHLPLLSSEHQETPTLLTGSVSPSIPKFISPILTKGVSPKNFQAKLSKKETTSQGYFDYHVSKKPTLAQIDSVTAKELAEDICHNYKLYEENASQSKEIKSKMAILFKTEGVDHIFNAKGTRVKSLALRIYTDLLEEAEMSPNANTMIRRNESKDFSHAVSKTPSSSTQNKFLPRGRLTKEKYVAYKKINENLQDSLLQYKLQNLQRLENTLIKAGEDLRLKKKQMLNHIENHEYNKATYRRMKKNFEMLGDVQPKYNYHDYMGKVERMQMYYGDHIKVDESKKVVNRNLGEILRKWTQKVHSD